MTALIADDEKHARDRLLEILKELNFFSKYIEAENAEQAAGFILKEDITACFLDINMPGISIFEVLRKMKDPPLVIFQTAYSEHAVKAFEIDALDYLLKPISMERLIACIEKIKKAVEKNKQIQDKENKARFFQKIPCKKEGRIELIDIEDIIKISSIDGLSFAFTMNEKFMLDKYLNYYEKNLDKTKFFRINRTDLINIKYIKIIHPMFKGNYIIELANKEELKLSRRKKSEFKKIYRLS